MFYNTCFETFNTLERGRTQPSQRDEKTQVGRRAQREREGWRRVLEKTWGRKRSPFDYQKERASRKQVCATSLNQVNLFAETLTLFSLSSYQSRRGEAWGRHVDARKNFRARQETRSVEEKKAIDRETEELKKRKNLLRERQEFKAKRGMPKLKS